MFEAVKHASLVPLRQYMPAPVHGPQLAIKCGRVGSMACFLGAPFRRRSEVHASDRLRLSHQAWHGAAI